MNKRQTYVAAIAFVSFLFLPGCSFFSPVSYYDPTTYRNLTDLKVYTAFLYDSFMEDSVDQKDIKYVKIRLQQTLEYEKGKGKPNVKTTEQIQLIIDEFEDYVANRMDQGKWNQSQRDNAVNNINKLFDTAISSESKKNKNE